MKPLKLSLRVWIAFTSLISFLVGWAIFSHSGKPAALFGSAGASTTTADPVVENMPLLPTLQPVPSLTDLTQSGSIQPLPTLQAQTLPSFNFNANTSANAPRLRTRGS
jgi:hypothetical protein